MTCLIFQSIEVLRHPDVAHVRMPSRMPKTSESNVETREGPNLQVAVRARCRRLDPAPPSHTAVAPTPSHAKSASKKRCQHNYCLQSTLVSTAGVASLHPVAPTANRIHHTSSIPQVVSTKPVSPQVLIAYDSLYRSCFRDFLCRMPLPPLVPTNSRLYHWAFP